MASSDTELYEPPRRSARLRKDRGGLVNEEPPKSKSKPAKKQVNKNHNFQAEKHTEFPDEYSGQPSDAVNKCLYNNPQPRDHRDISEETISKIHKGLTRIFTTFLLFTICRRFTKPSVKNGDNSALLLGVFYVKFKSDI